MREPASSRPAMAPSKLAAQQSAEARDRPRRRASSNASASSTVSATSPKSEDQFVFSPGQASAAAATPSYFAARSSNPPASSTAAGAGAGHTDAAHDPTARPSPNTTSANDGLSSPRSQPIAIEKPPSIARQIYSKSVYTPIEPPLSARGDISGGFFPFHEDPNKRVNRPHPFHDGIKDAQSSVDLAPRPSSERPTIESEPVSQQARRPPLPKLAISEPIRAHRLRKPSTMPTSRANTPVTSYAPSGHHNVPVAVGKYYPSNYEARQKQRSGQSTPASQGSLNSPSSTGLSSVRSDTVVPQVNRTDTPRARSGSELQNQIRQYQRDMMTQMQQMVGRQDPASASLAASHGVPLPLFHGRSNRPVSPRLLPLGSPGPVTPMQLESGQGEEDGYLTRGRPVPSPDALRDNQAVARAKQADEERRRREGRGSPAVEAGGFGF